MGRAIALRDDFDAAALRKLTKNCQDGPQARRLDAQNVMHFLALVWGIIFSAFFLLSIIVGIIQYWKSKELWDTPTLPVWRILYYAWGLPLTVFIICWPIAKVLGLVLS